MNLVFVTPLWLWLLLLVPLIWFVPFRATKRRHALIRSAVVVLLVLALAKPALLTEQDDSYQVLVWDRSESINAPTAAAVDAWTGRLSDTARARVVTLGRRDSAPEIDGITPLQLDESSIGRGLSAAARLIPEGATGAVTVVSDGMSTDPHWGDAVRQLTEREIPVHTIAVKRPGNEVYPAAIRTSPPLRVGQSTKLAVDVIGTAEEVVVSLLSDGNLLARSTPFAARERSTVVLEFEPAQPGLLDVTAEVQVVTGADPNPDNNRFDSTLAVQEPIKALYLSERLTNSRDRMNALTGPGVELAEPSDAQVQVLAKNPEGIAAYELVVIDDRPAESIPLPVQDAIVQAVRNDGVGLFYAGGKGVFGTGGYFDTPVASILPVEMIQKEEKRDPSTTLVVIIDTSGSMSGERVQLAKECARLAIRRLLPHDKVGIVEFYGTKQWAAPIQSAANAIDIQRAINRMDAGGGTVILPAIEEAFYAMQNVQTRYKHVLVLTDGGVESGDFESLMRRMAAKGINVSTVLVGSDAHSEFLVNIANWGKGHFYSASSRFNIPEVLLKQPSTSKIPPYRPGEHLVSMGGPSGWWGDIPRPENPQLAGYVETRLRPGAQVAIETETERHPVLASWRYGLGRVSAFTTEPVGEGTAPWREWDGYGAWLMRTLSRTSREHPQPFSYTIERSPSGARVVAQRLTPQLYLPAAERIADDGSAEPLVFQQRSPDVFTAKLLEAPDTTIHLRAGAAGWPGREAHLVSPAWHAVAPEHNVDPQRAVDLAALATATGGQSVTLDTVSQLRPSAGGTGTATDLHRLWPWCLVLALLSYLGDILYRRWPGTATSGAGRNAAAALIVGLVFLPTSPSKAEITPALEAKLQATLKQDAFQVDDGALYAAALLEDESLDPLLERLDAIIAGDAQAFDAIWLAASLKWRYGLLDDSLELFQKAAEVRAEALPLFRVAQLLDAKGKTTDAATQYLKALEAKPDDALAGRIQLRLALLKSTEDNIENVDEDLPAFARKQDQTFQNRAGVVLALTGKPKDALALYKATGEGNDAFKQLIRIAEWSIAAKDFSKAQESAWGALRSAKLKRDRRYALTVLAEAYRSDKKLDALVERFAATPDLSAEARMTWIELLREQGNVDQALALFKEAKADGEESFTADMRREMLEICREAGRNDLLVTNYREMIAKEPRRLEWRSGLCRFHLERGERDQGIAVWKDYKDQAKRGDWLAAAGAAMELGLDELARSFAEELIEIGEGTERLAALQFLFDLHKTRGREDDMKSILNRMDELAAPGASERARIAESWEQLGRQDKAVEVLKKLREARKGEDFSSDLETRLAWLYSETGAEEKAFEAWKRVWLRIESPGRRRYVEDRFMATASRLGKLADIAIELEEKLADGTADKRDSALLVRLYTKVGDPVSASEIIHDFMKQSGGNEIKMLEEQARVYVMCNDYYHYEKTLRKLMQLDPEGTPEYYTQLAMSALERGRNDEARNILTEMRNLAQNPASAEFEAGVLKIAGMHQEANAAYWRGIAQHPDRIDAYLLLGRSLQTLGKAPQATGLFQYLVETAGKDDLFTIAIDGLLNMNNPRQGSRLSPETLRWARRAILERIASRDDKVYLFQLLSDVSEDLRDRDMMIRTLAETLPVAGERRTAQLRELMELAKATSRDNKDGMMRFGRRLVGMGEIIPPQVYLDLGNVFLDSGDVRNALKTFGKADGGLDEAGYQRKVADAFEKKRFARSALRSYEQLLITAPDDVSVLVKVGELKEQLGRDAEARIAYRRALDLLMDGQPLFSFKGRKTSGSRTYYYSRNVDRFDKFYLRVLTGFLATGDLLGTATAELIDDSLQALKSDLVRLEKERADLEDGETLGLENVPRVARRSQMIRRLCLAGGQLEKGGTHEQLMLSAFPKDSSLLPDICRTWNEWGYAEPARGWAKALADQDLRQRALELLDTKNTGGGRALLQLVLQDKDADARARLRDVEQLIRDSGGSASFNFLFTMARYLDDSAAVERLTRFAISRAPKSQRLTQSISMLSRAFPSLNQTQRDRLIAHVESLIADQDAGATQSAYYYYPRLQQLTGKEFKLPAEAIRPEIEKMLARGGYYNRYVASMFSFLEDDDYRSLLTDTYRKSKASDRLTLVFGLVRQYPGTMTPGMQATFLELAGDAAEANTQDPLQIYQRSAPNPHYGGKLNTANAGFEALLLEKFAKDAPEDQQLDFLIEQIRAWHRAEDREQALGAIAKALDLAMQDDKAFTRILSLQSTLPDDFLDGFLAALDKRAEKNGTSVADEQKRLRLVRATHNPERLFTALRESIRRFPKELGFRQELRKELEQQGRLFEAASVQEDLAKLEPDNEQHRTDLQDIWMRLAHPIKAGKTKKPVEELEAKQATPTSTPVTATKTANPPTPGPTPPPAKPAKPSGPAQEKPLDVASAQLLKKQYEAGELDQAGVTLRRLWRQFANLNRYAGRMYRMPSTTSSRYYTWPTDKKSSPRRPTSGNTPPGKNGLKAFLATDPPPLPSVSRTSQPTGETIFSAIGSEEFVAAELQTWLRTFEPGNFQTPLFEDIIGAVVRQRIEAEGAETFITNGITRFQEGRLSALDQHAMLAAIELHPEAGGQAANEFLDLQRSTLAPGDLWKTLRLARCFAQRGNKDAAIALYRWCGANAGYSSYISSSRTNVTANHLIEEVRRHLHGDSRRKAFKAILPLIHVDNPNSSSSRTFAQFVLTTWAEEFAPHEVYQHCPNLCGDLVHSDPPNPRGGKTALELATLFLAAAGETDDALHGLQRLLVPETNPTPDRYGRTSSNHTPSRANHLQRLFPEDMSAWRNAGPWLAGTAERVRTWHTDQSLPTADAMKTLALVAVRQHQNGFTSEAQATLATAKTLPLHNPKVATWLLDAAELTGNTDLAIDVATTLLAERRLPIKRIAPLMEGIAAQQGAPAALALAESTLDYTWEPTFLQTMARIATEAGDNESAQRWTKRHQQVAPEEEEEAKKDEQVPPRS